MDLRNSAAHDSHSCLSIVARTTVTPDDRHCALRAPSRAAVRAFPVAALQSGGRDDGGIRERPEYLPAYYSAFVLDPTGNRVEVGCHLGLRPDTTGT